MLKDAVSLYFADATLSNAFVARWCVGSKVETIRPPLDPEVKSCLLLVFRFVFLVLLRVEF